MKMKKALLELSEAVRLARLEIACYRDDMCRGSAKGTVDRLAKILGNEDVYAASWARTVHDTGVTISN